MHLLQCYENLKYSFYPTVSTRLEWSIIVTRKIQNLFYCHLNKNKSQYNNIGEELWSMMDELFHEIGAAAIQGWSL